LTVSVASLGPTPEAISASEATRVLADLADALDALFGTSAPEAARVRDAAARLNAAQTPNVLATIQDGLSAALTCLVHRTPPRGRESEYRRAVNGMTRALRTLKASPPPQPWSTPVVSVLRDAADAIALAQGIDAPFAAPEATARQQLPSSFDAGIEAARKAVLKLGRADWTDARAFAADALAAIADALAVGRGSEQVQEQISRLRFQAERLRRAGPTDLGQGKTVKVGLSAALDVLDALATALQSDARVQWLSNARAAVAGINGDEPLTFQRATIQDAYRTTLAAVAVIAGAG
jgi:hypothetical protein